MRTSRLLIALALLSLAAVFAFVKPIPQSQAYHAFADARELVRGVPNTLNVLSNVAFAIAGIAGLLVMRRQREFANAYERRDALVFFAGTIVTAIGSSIYHLHPNDATLVYDRCGMIVAFVAFIAMFVHERLDGAPWLVVAFLAIATASIVVWRVFDDLRFYGWVQFFPMLAVLVLAFAERARHTGEAAALVGVIASYGLAKVAEEYDRAIYATLGHTVSGHTLKHLLAAVAPAIIAIWIARRQASSPRHLDGAAA